MSLIKVKITDQTVSKRDGISSKTGKPYSMLQQAIFVELHDEVRKIDLTLPENSSGYAPGHYTINPTDLIMIGRFGFELNRFNEIKLTPVQGNLSALNTKTG